EGRTLFLQRLGNTCRAAHRSCVPRQARDEGDGYVASKIDKRARARKTLDQLRFDQRGALQGLAHRAARGDLQEALALRIVERTLERHPPAEAIDLARALGALYFYMAQRHRDFRERPVVALCIDAHRHRRAGTERRQEQFIGRRAGVAPARAQWLVGAEDVMAGGDELRVRPVAALADDDRGRLRLAHMLLPSG